MMSWLLRGEEAYIRAWQERAARIKTELPDKIRRREPVSRNVEALHQERLSFGERHWDKYPYILLNLFLSMLAALQRPLIMTSQKRAQTHIRLCSEHDYEINLKA